MREIKFRAWDKVAGSMFTDDVLLGLTFTGIIVDDYGQELDTPMELMQYTGLKDKNGNAIIYLVDEGCQVVVLASDFTPS